MPAHYDPPEFPSKKSVVPPRPKLTGEQEGKYKQVLNFLLEKETFPMSEKGADKNTGPQEPLTDEEKAWLSEECILRYLRATKWNVEDAQKRLLSTLGWRREFGVERTRSNTITASKVAVENESGKELIFGFDNDARPCLALRNGRQNTEASQRQVEHMFFMLERAIDFMPPGQEQLALLIDFKAHTKLGKKVPSMTTGRQVLHILQTHYPERLGKALLTNLPWIAWTFMKIIHPFIDPTTREKLVYTKPFPDYVPREQLEKEYGGDVDFEYVQAKYWPKLNQMADKKNADFMAQYHRLGGGIGLSEQKMRQPLDDADAATLVGGMKKMTV